jgi:ABC-2 type transport system ATP-binding protein
MEEAERLCDRIVIIDHGKVIADDTLAGLHRLLPVQNVLTVELAKVDGLATRMEPLRKLPEVESVELNNGTLRVGLHDLASGASTVLQWLAANGWSFEHVASERPTLETVFLTLTGRSLRDTR